MTGGEREISVTVAPLENLFTYKVPQELNNTVSLGSRVLVPLGKRTTFGFVVPQKATNEIEEKTPKKNFVAKEISSLTLPCNCFDERQLLLFEWISKFYSEPLSSVIDLAIPKPVPGKKESLVHLIGESTERLGDSQKSIIQYLRDHGPTSLSFTKKKCAFGINGCTGFGKT